MLSVLLESRLLDHKCNHKCSLLPPENSHYCNRIYLIKLYKNINKMVIIGKRSNNTDITDKSFRCVTHNFLPTAKVVVDMVMDNYADVQISNSLLQLLHAGCYNAQLINRLVSL